MRQLRAIARAVTSYAFASAGLLACSSPARHERHAKQFELIPDWPGDSVAALMGQPSGLGFAADGHLLVFHRGTANQGASPERIAMNAVVKIDPESGHAVQGWGSNKFLVPHGLSVDGSGNVWLTDVGLHQVFKFSADGILLLELGIPGVAGDDSLHFDRPTDVAVAKDGSFYVADGYGNSRVIKFSADGRYVMEWGRKGAGPGEFDLPHAVDLDEDGNVLVADRANSRIQKFDPQGRFIAEWNNPAKAEVYSVCVLRDSGEAYVTDYAASDAAVPGSDIIHLAGDLSARSRFGRSGSYDGPACRYHDIAVDGRGNIYVADLLGKRVQKFRPVPMKSK